MRRRMRAACLDAAQFTQELRRGDAPHRARAEVGKHERLEALRHARNGLRIHRAMTPAPALRILGDHRGSRQACQPFARHEFEALGNRELVGFSLRARIDALGDEPTGRIASGARSLQRDVGVDAE